MPTLKGGVGGGVGARNGKDVVSVFETLWKKFFKWLVLELSANIMK